VTDVGYIRLHSTGWFVCRLGFWWMNPADKVQHQTSGSGKDIDINQTETSDPGAWGVPDGSQVWPHIDVVAGDDHDGSIQDGLVYRTGTPVVATYHIWGYTLDNHLHLDGFGPLEWEVVPPQP
jgi:hypothetical protein